MPIEVKLMYIFVDFVGIIILLLLRFDFGTLNKSKKEYMEFSERIFHYILFATLIVFITDMFSWWLNKNSELIALNYFVTTIFFISQPLVSSLWIVYVDDKLRGDVKETKKLIPVFLAPAVFLGILSSLSFKYQLFFGIARDGSYYRGSYYLVFIICNMLYFVYSTVKVIEKMRTTKKIYDRQKYRVLLKYPIFPIAGTIIQTFVHGVNAAWLLTTISLIVIYFNLQNNQLTRDSLTGLNNRYRFDQYIDDKLMLKNFSGIIFLAMIDMDKFKSINDNYGHLEGDKALITVSKLVLKGIDDSDFFARLGGDEFIIVGSRQKESEIVSTLDKIHQCVANYNQLAKVPYKISLSMGYSFFDKDNAKNRDELIKEADSMMYQTKKNKYIAIEQQMKAPV